MVKELFLLDLLLVLFVLHAVDAISFPRPMDEPVDDDDEEIPSWSRCPFIRNKLKNGRVKLRSRGRIAKFMCDPGYELAGKRFTTCVRGQWNNPIPVCVSRGCSRTPVVPNARVSEMYRGAVLLYECLPGYSMQGGATVYCDGRQWSSEAPMCEVSATNPLLTCDFEDPNLCGWSHDPTHDFDWKRNQFDTPSGHVGTGPTSDHTFGPGKGGFYLYMEASSPRKVNDTARLFSPVYTYEHSGGCFVFWYHMFGSTTGGLRVYVKPESQVFGELSPTWNEYGDQGNRWIRGNVTIPQFNENFQVVIEGIRGSSYIGDTAIDDVSLNSEDCSNIGNITDQTPEFVSNSCRGRCRESNESYACGCNDDCMASTSEIPCCRDFFELCTKSAHGTENPEEYSASTTTTKLATVETSSKPESSSSVDTTTSSFSTSISHSYIPPSVTELSTTTYTPPTLVSSPIAPIFSTSTTPTLNVMNSSSSTTTKILSTTSVTPSSTSTTSSTFLLPLTSISTTPSTSTNTPSTISTMPFRISSLKYISSTTPLTTSAKPSTTSTTPSTTSNTPSTTSTTPSTTSTTPSTTSTTQATISTRPSKISTPPSTSSTTPSTTSTKLIITPTTHSKASTPPFITFTTSSTTTSLKTSIMHSTITTNHFTTSTKPSQPSITALTTPSVTPATPPTTKSTTSTMRPTAPNLPPTSSVTVFTTNINSVSPTKFTASHSTSSRPFTITTARSITSTKTTPLTSTSTVKTTSSQTSTIPTKTTPVGTSYPKFVSSKATTRNSYVYPVTVEETRRTYNLRPRFRTTPIPFTRIYFRTSTRQYYRFTTKSTTPMLYTRPLSTTTTTTPSTSLVTSSQLVSTASSSSITRGVSNTTDITSMSKKDQHSSTSTSTASESSQSTVTIASVVLMLAVCIAGGFIFYCRRWKARRQSKLADDSEMRFLYENEYAEFSDASALEKMNTKEPLI